MTSITVTFTGDSSSLSSSFHPEIELDERFNYSCCLLDFCTYNSIPNIHTGNNVFNFQLDQNTESGPLEIPPGSYELVDIGDLLEKAVANAYFERDVAAETKKLKEKNDDEEKESPPVTVVIPHVKENNGENKSNEEIEAMNRVIASDRSDSNNKTDNKQSTSKISEVLNNSNMLKSLLAQFASNDAAAKRKAELEEKAREETKQDKKKRAEQMKKKLDDLKKREFRVIFNKNNLTTTIKTGNPNMIIAFNGKRSIGKVLGFNNRTLHHRNTYESDSVTNIQHITAIRVDCDIISGSYNNGEKTHTIYEFIPTVDPGNKIVEQPQNLIYLPVNRHRIHNINLRVVDQCGNLVDFRGEQITCRLHIKRDY